MQQRTIVMLHPSLRSSLEANVKLEVSFVLFFHHCKSDKGSNSDSFIPFSPIVFFLDLF